MRKADWVKLFRKTFRRLTGAFLMSTGTQKPDCPVYAAIAARNLSWMQAQDGFWDD